jgi:hypothetical protein
MAASPSSKVNDFGANAKEVTDSAFVSFLLDGSNLKTFK